MITQTFRLFLEYNRAVARQVLRQEDNGNIQVKGMCESEGFVKNYAPKLELQPPEAEILQELRDDLPNFRMLDIGVGAGRTTQHFAEVVREYVGIDYSTAMIEVCKTKFPQYRLEVADARDLSMFENGYFDFVLFSFNGIDAVGHDDRLIIMREIRRVLRKGGYFCFSSLNLNSRRLRPVIKFYKDPILMTFDVYNFILNSNLRSNKKNGHEMIFLKDRDFFGRLYYITPSEQLRQLETVGFVDTVAYDFQSGKRVADPRTMLGYWVYFLTRAS